MLSYLIRAHPEPDLWYSAELVQTRKGLSCALWSSVKSLQIWALWNTPAVLTCIPPWSVSPAKDRCAAVTRGWCTIAWREQCHKTKRDWSTLQTAADLPKSINGSRQSHSENSLGNCSHVYLMEHISEEPASSRSMQFTAWNQQPPCKWRWGLNVLISGLINDGSQQAAREEWSDLCSHLILEIWFASGAKSIFIAGSEYGSCLTI